MHFDHVFCLRICIIHDTPETARSLHQVHKVQELVQKQASGPNRAIGPPSQAGRLPEFKVS